MSPAADVLPVESLYAQCGDDAERAWLLNRKAIAMEEDDPAHMLELAERARELAARAGDREAWAYSCRNSGVAHHLLSHAAEARADLQASIAQFEALGLPQGVALALGNIATVYQDGGRYDLALECQLRCMKICEDLGDEQGKGRNMLHMAELYCAMEEDERALEYCEQSLAIARKWNDRNTLGTALANIGTIYARLGLLDRAWDCQQESLAIKEEAGNTLGIAVGLGNIAALQVARNETDQALGMYELSLQLREELGDRRGMAVMLRNIADLYAQRGKNDRALLAMQQALSIAIALNLPALAMQLHADCARVHESTGNIPEAFRHLKAAMELRQEGNERAHLKHVAALELEYDREHDRALRAGLRHRVYDLEHLTLRSQLNPHFLHNALSSIQFFITNNDRDSAHRYLAKLGKLLRLSLNQSRVPLIALASEWEGVQLYIDMEQLRFGDRFAWEVHFDPRLSADEIFVPPMLLQPFVENAVHHGLLPLGSKGKLTVRVSQPEEDTVTYIIEDNGIGRQESARRRELSRNGVAHQSVGMRLIEDRLALLRERTNSTMRVDVADLTNDSGEATGTRVELTLPATLSLDDVR